MHRPTDGGDEAAAARAPESARLLPRGGRRLLAAAALLHVALAVGLFAAGRARVAPSLVDRDGIMPSFAFDSYEYRLGAERLEGVLRERGLSAWAAAQGPAHVKLIALQFALLGPLFGHSTLSAEPLNLLCYVAVVGLALALGNEVGGCRAGLLAGAVVALWPTLLLHTTQLLKDPLFIAGALALVLVVTTWLTRDYGWRAAAAATALLAAVAGLLLLVRGKFAPVVFALVLFGLALLVLRQLLERRVLYWNTLCPLLVLAAAAWLNVYAANDGRAVKLYPPDGGGPPKAVADAVRLRSEITYAGGVRAPKAESATLAGRLREAVERVTTEAASNRYRYNVSFPESGSGIDRDVGFARPGDVAAYLPRAAEIGFWAPFPDTWGGAGKTVGGAGRRLAAAETFAIYLCQLLALAAVLRAPRRIAAWLLLSAAAFGMTVLGLVVSNVGTLYRFRYTFWVLLIVLAAKGLAGVRDRRGAGGAAA
ncbi:MAG TPA: hypothetical protein VF736_13530 [Pyrinomonadaceae bacterium]